MTRPITHKNLLTILFLAPLLTGCLAVAVGAGGVLLGQEVMENNTYVAQVRVDTPRVWATTKSSLSHLSPEPIHTDEDLQEAKADVEGSTVVVQVEIFDVGKSTIRVSASKFGVPRGEVAQNVLNRILKDLES